MNLKEAKRLQPGAIVRESWCGPHRTGLVLSKTHIVEEHTAKMLCQRKSQRYDVVVHWFKGARTTTSGYGYRENPELLQNWEIMVVSHG